MALKSGGLRGSLRNISQVSVIPDSGVARWEYEQDLTDSWNGYDGTANGDPQFTTTAQEGSYARDYDGTDDYDNFGNVTEPSGASEFSIVGWFRPASTGSNFRLIMKKSGSADVGAIGFNLDDSGAIRFACGDGSTNNNVTGSTLSASTWYHIAGIFNSGAQTLYLDGSVDGSADVLGSSLESSTGDVTVGGPDSGGFTYYDGIADHTDLYSKALTQTEVQNHRDTGSING